MANTGLVGSSDRLVFESVCFTCENYNLDHVKFKWTLKKIFNSSREYIDYTLNHYDYYEYDYKYPNRVQFQSQIKPQMHLNNKKNTYIFTTNLKNFEVTPLQKKETISKVSYAEIFFFQ